MVSQQIANSALRSQIGTTSSAQSDGGNHLSTKLTLFDEACQTEKREAITAPVPRAFSEADLNKREVASKIMEMKRYCPREEEEERRKGVSTKLGLHPYPGNIRKKLTKSGLGHLSSLLLQKDLIEADVNKREVTSKIMEMKRYSPREEEEERRKGVSTKLRLYPYPGSIRKKLTKSDLGGHLRRLWLQKDLVEADLNKREVASKIMEMKRYSPGEEEEERRKGVSTKLGLHPYPWNIRKKVTRSDLGHSSRLLLKKDLVDDYVKPFMSIDSFEKIQSMEGLRVAVWDYDTDSTHNQLVLKKWPSSNSSYVFIGKWCKDFVKRRNLQEGDEIAMCWDAYHSRFNFRVLNRN